ncbi:hypothetical protein [Amycolatopsis sp. WGS_07]|uniref:hypothetical protein n=1 Tax=Amycolatopsis sp. WGS_07 TaxID=3076764 RepID=UPI003872F8D7
MQAGFVVGVLAGEPQRGAAGAGAAPQRRRRMPGHGAVGVHQVHRGADGVGDEREEPRALAQQFGLRDRAHGAGQVVPGQRERGGTGEPVFLFDEQLAAPGEQRLLGRCLRAG